MTPWDLGSPGAKGHSFQGSSVLAWGPGGERSPAWAPSKHGREVPQTHLCLCSSQVGSGQLASVSQAGVCCADLRSPRNWHRVAYTTWAPCSFMGQTHDKRAVSRSGASWASGAERLESSVHLVLVKAALLFGLGILSDGLCS